MFLDRQDAGRQLAQVLASRTWQHPIVLGLPRGGVPLAAEVARALHAPLDVAIAHKIGVPDQPEVAMGAVAEDGTLLWDRSLVHRLQLSPDEARQAAEQAMRDVQNRVRHLRRRPLPALEHATVILVDDGLATGFTMEAAVRMAKALGAAKVVAAVPVGPASVVRHLQALADDVVCLHMPRDFDSVGRYYVDFTQVEDDEVQACLASAWAAAPPQQPA